jgi:hypothetical protein
MLGHDAKERTSTVLDGKQAKTMRLSSLDVEEVGDVAS